MYNKKEREREKARINNSKERNHDGSHCFVRLDMREKSVLFFFLRLLSFGIFMTTFMSFKTYTCKFFEDKIIIMTRIIETRRTKFFWFFFRREKLKKKQTLHRVELNYDRQVHRWVRLNVVDWR